MKRADENSEPEVNINMADIDIDGVWKRNAQDYNWSQERWSNKCCIEV